MNAFDTRTAAGQVFPYPEEGDTVLENPPCLIWLSIGKDAVYTAGIYDESGKAVWTGTTDKNYIVPEKPLPAGSYLWNVEAGGLQKGRVRFTVPEDTVIFVRPRAREIFDSVPDMRPRELFTKKDIESILKDNPEAAETLKRNAAMALEHGMPVPPMFHRDKDALPYREYFGIHRDFVDRDLVACCLAHQLFDDEKAAAHAKELFLTLCDWNSEGPCSLESVWGDEIGLSHARCFPAVYDMLWDVLDEKQRVFCGRVVALYAYQCERRLKKLDFCLNPGSSHAGRLPAYLGEAAMVLKGTGIVEEEVLIRWLSYAVEIYGGIFPYFGGRDGGWAEGTFYSSSYTKWYLPFFNAVERFSGVSFLNRPFFRNYINYLRAFCPPGWENHPFSDGYWCKSEDAEWPGFMAQNPYHVYAERFGSEMTRAWSRQAMDKDCFRLHLLDVFLPSAGKHEQTETASRAQIFPYTGYVSLHTDPARPESELALLARCSRFGAASHSHADQGSFALMAGGTALISPSGYFGRRYGSKHHALYTQQTIAHNTLLINGVGQENRSHRTVGKVLYAKDGGVLTAAIEPTDAYDGRIDKWIREFSLTENALTVTDRVKLKEKGRLSYLLHTLSRPVLRENTVCVDRNIWHMEISGSLTDPVITDSFPVDLNEGEPEKYHVSMPPQYHLRYETEEGTEFTIVMRYEVSAKPV